MTRFLFRLSILTYASILIGCSNEKEPTSTALTVEMPSEVISVEPGQNRVLRRIDSARYANITNGDTLGMYYVSEQLLDSIEFPNGMLRFQHNDQNDIVKIQYNGSNGASRMEFVEEFQYTDGQLSGNRVTYTNFNLTDGTWIASDSRVDTRTVSAQGDTITIMDQNGSKLRSYLQNQRIMPLLFHWPYTVIFEGGPISYDMDERGRVSVIRRNGNPAIELKYDE